MPLSKLSRILCIFFVLLAVQVGSISEVQAAEEINFREVQLDLDDLPEGFSDGEGSDSISFEKFSQHLISRFGQEAQPDLYNVRTYRYEDEAGLSVISTGVMFPLTDSQKLALHSIFVEEIDSLNDLIGGTSLDQRIDQGETVDRYSISNQRRCGMVNCIHEYVALVREDVLLLVSSSYPQVDEPVLDVQLIVDLLDRRLTSSQAIPDRPYRPEVNLVPKISTYIPTPLEVSLNPWLLIVNLILAAVLFLAFLIGANYLPKLLSKHEYELQALKKPIQTISDGQRELDSWIQNQLHGRLRLTQIIKIARIMLFYALVYSLLEPGWKPFSSSGIFLFFTMLIANGLVGLSDDLLRWKKLIQWRKSCALRTHPTNVFLSASSVFISRLLVLRPGLMFGTPELLDYEENALGEDQQTHLETQSMYLGLGIILLTWFPTILTNHYMQTVLTEKSRNIIANLESLLLIIFAVELENLFLFFVELARKDFVKTSQWPSKEYSLGLIGTTFAFFHILINPQGDLFQALLSGSMFRWMLVVILFLVLIAVFYIVYQWPKKFYPERQKLWLRRIIAAGGILIVLTGFVDFFAHRPLQTDEDLIEPSYSFSTPLYQATQQHVEAFRSEIKSGSTSSTSWYPADWPLIAYETFDTSDGQWEMTGGANLSGFDLIQTNAGMLTFTPESSHGESLIYAAVPLRSAGDFYLAYDFRQISGPEDTEGGLFFHMQDSNVFYYLGINSDGQLWLLKNDEDQWEELISGNVIENYQSCRWNRLSIIVQDEQLRLYLNDKSVARLVMEELSAGKFGLAAWFARANESATWQMDNLEFRVPNDQSGALP